MMFLVHSNCGTVCMPGCGPNNGFLFSCTAVGRASYTFVALCRLNIFVRFIKSSI